MEGRMHNLKLDFESRFNKIRLLDNRGIHLPFLALPPIPDFELSDHQYYLICYSKFRASWTLAVMLVYKHSQGGPSSFTSSWCRAARSDTSTT